MDQQFFRDKLIEVVMQRDVPTSVLIEFAKKVKIIPPAEREVFRERFAHEIEKKYPYKPGDDPNMPGTPLAEVAFAYPASAGIEDATKRLNIKRDRLKLFRLEGMLHIGDIRERIDSDYRRHLIGSIEFAYCNETDYTEESLLRSKRIKAYWTYLLEYLEAGKQLRIWYSNDAEELCGFYHLCTLLRHYNQTFYVVRLPETAKIDGELKKVYCWSNLTVEAIGKEIGNTRILSSEEIQMFAQAWEELQKDNSPLRIVTNGQLTGVGIDYYDRYLLEALRSGNATDIESVFQSVCGQINPINAIRTGWLMLRIDDLISQGTIEVVEDNEEKWKRKLRLRSLAHCH